MLRTNLTLRSRRGFCCLWLLGVFSVSALAAPASTPVHGLWVWKSPAILEQPRGAETLLDFCRSEGINEVYVSVSERSVAADERQLTHLIALLHGSNAGSHIRVEALLSSVDADEPGKHRDSLLRHVHEIVKFNRRHAPDRFDGIHLDIEPQQRPENKGAGNLRFLPDLAGTFRAVSAVANPAGMTVNADIQSKLLKGTPVERTMLLTSVSRVTLMMYELSSPTDGESIEQKGEKVQERSGEFLNMAYSGLGEPNLARMVIALRTPDYGELLPQMLKKLEGANRGNPHYLGWARHSYNDYLKQ
jgi:hypothetical protein